MKNIMDKLFPISADYYDRIFDRRKRNLLRILRFSCLIYHAVMIVLTIMRYTLEGLFIFFTHWGLMMNFIAFGFMLASSYLADQPDWRLVMHKIAYVMFEVGWTMQCVITIFYWTLLSWNSNLGNADRVLIAIEVHCIPILCLLADFLINKTPFQFNHIFFSIIPGILYFILNITMAYACDRIIYSILTWKNWVSLPIALGAIILFIGGFISGYYIGRKLYETRQFIARDEGLL